MTIISGEKGWVMNKILLLFYLVFFTLPAYGQVYQIGKPAPDFSLYDSEGVEHHLSQYRGKYVVLEWTNFECIFVKKFYRSYKMTDLQEEFTERNVIWLTICSSAPGKEGSYGEESLNDKLEEIDGYQTAYLLDETGEIAEKYMVQVTPQAYIIDPGGNLIYAGGMDDKPSTIPLHTKTATNFVQVVLNAVLNGDDPPFSETKPYGCGIKR